MNQNPKQATASGRHELPAETSAEIYELGHRFHAVVDTAVDAILTIDVGGVIESFNPAAERMFGYAAEEAIGRNVSILMPQPHSERHGEYIRRYLRTNEPHVIGRVRELEARRKDGSVFPIRLSVAEIDHLGLFTGIVRDVTEENLLQEEVVRIATLEQRRIGQELHDHTQQELTGLGLLAESLAESLDSDHSMAKTATRLATGIADANRRIRALARGLIPVDVDAAGLMDALARLAADTEELNGLDCRFECPSCVTVRDDAVATHLYRIAQEATTNAVKHASPSVIVISLVADERYLTLEIEDDGTGIQHRVEPTRGVGMRIMAHRCALIRGEFKVRQLPSGGTTVSCVLTL